MTGTPSSSGLPVPANWRPMALTLYRPGPSAVVPYQARPSAVTPYRQPPSAVMPYQSRPTAVVPREPGPSALIQLPVNQTSLQIVQAFSSSGGGAGGGATGGGFSSTTRSWWFTLLVMGGLFYWMDSDEDGALVSARKQISANKGKLKWIDRAYAYTPTRVVKGALWASKKVGALDVDQAADSAIGDLEKLMPPLDSAIAGFKAGLNPGPFRYAFAGSDPRAILRFATFLLAADDADWEQLIRTVAPIRSAPTIVRSVKAEFARLGKYPAAGWLAGSALGCALPLNVPIVTLVLAYNLVGASLAYSKAIDELDRELASAAPHVHNNVNRHIDAVIARRYPGVAKRLQS
jgi:hypothetical protein